MEIKHLPIGTVVQLKGSDKRVMITGYLCTEASHPDTVWDYSAVKFPLGFVDAKEMLCFNNASIETICVLGYVDLEQMEFIDKIDAIADEIRNQGA